MNKIPCREKVWIPLNNVLEKRNLRCGKVVDNPKKATPEVAVQLILKLVKTNFFFTWAYPMYHGVKRTCHKLY